MEVGERGDGRSINVARIEESVGDSERVLLEEWVEFDDERRDNT